MATCQRLWRFPCLFRRPKRAFARSIPDETLQFVGIPLLQRDTALPDGTPLWSFEGEMGAFSLPDWRQFAVLL